MNTKESKKGKKELLNSFTKEVIERLEVVKGGPLGSRGTETTVQRPPGE